MVYFISDGNRVKIGYSNDIDKRLRELQTGSSNELTVVNCLYGNYDTEKIAHKYFKSQNVIGEWRKKN